VKIFTVPLISSLGRILIAIIADQFAMGILNGALWNWLIAAVAFFVRQRGSP
jgi:hypothetical protein